MIIIHLVWGWGCRQTNPPLHFGLSHCHLGHQEEVGWNSTNSAGCYLSVLLVPETCAMRLLITSLALFRNGSRKVFSYMTSTYFKFRDSPPALLPTLHFPEIQTPLPDELFEVTFGSIKHLPLKFTVFSFLITNVLHHELEDPIWIKTITRNT